MTALRLTGVSKSFGAVAVLRNVDLAVDVGEFVVFVGPSGCGKSTLLRVIAGLEDATSGTIEIDGKCVNDTPPAKRGTAMVFQSYALYTHLSGNAQDRLCQTPLASQYSKEECYSLCVEPIGLINLTL